MRTRLMITGILLACFAQAAVAADLPTAALAQGMASCDQGNYTLAIDALQVAYRQHSSGPLRARAAGSLGLTYARLRQPAVAEIYLKEAVELAADPLERARYSLDLANLVADRGQVDAAHRLYDAALAMAPGDGAIATGVDLNRVALQPQATRLAALQELFRDLDRVPLAKDRAAFALNLGAQAKASGAAGAALAYQAFELARMLGQQSDDTRLHAAALDRLAQLYEDQRRDADALLLTERGIRAAQRPDARDLLIDLEWRRGRIFQRQGELAPAIAAYQRAVDQIEAIRLDIPVEYQDGRSSFRDTLEPVYLGLADLLLRQAGTLGGAQQARQLRRARNTVELIKQTELEDFLGDRCAIGSIRSALKDDATGTALARGTAVLYPIILPDRLELLIETANGLQRATVALPAAELRRDVLQVTRALRARQSFQILARKLYDALLLPVAATIERDAIDTLVVVPDGVLRLLPFGALHDGQRFAIEKYAIAMVPGLTMTNTQARPAGARGIKTLLAGVSEPGAVVEKLPDYMTRQLLASPPQSTDASGPRASRAMFTRGLQSRNVTVAEDRPPELAPVTKQSVPDLATRHDRLRKILALAGVKEEIEMLGKLAPGRTLLNQDFSMQAFGTQVESGDYQVIHIASHGVFGGTADTTFIMAHDELITIDKLQGFLRSRGVRDRPIDLLTLSACETAEGDDRAPLGLSGAALKAQARSALGSLWPVSDDAAKTLMGGFYQDLSQTGVTKAAALRSAQLRLIADPGLQHPYFWAPFILVGNWQ